MNDKPFNRSIKILKDDGWILINGEQITKVVMVRREDKRTITFHLSDGSTYEFDEKLSKELLSWIESQDI